MGADPGTMQLNYSPVKVTVGLKYLVKHVFSKLE